MGKARLAGQPWINHSWHATFYESGRGLRTALIPGDEHSYEGVFDFIDHTLARHTTDGRQTSIALEPMAVAQFYERFTAALADVGVSPALHDTPNEIVDPVPFHEQTEAGVYEPALAQDFWRALVAIERVFTFFRTGYLGKVSPVHLFWGGFDLAVTRFSGRSAPLHPGSIPALPDAVTRKAYSHEVSSAGFWPGGGTVQDAAFYSW